MSVQIACSICIFIMCKYRYLIFALTHLLPFHVPWPGKGGKHPSSSNFCAKLQCFQQLGRVSGLPQLKDVEIVRDHELFKRYKSVCGCKHTFERHPYGMEAVLSSSEKGNSSEERLREVVEGSKREEVNKQVMSPSSR